MLERYEKIALQVLVDTVNEICNKLSDLINIYDEKGEFGVSDQIFEMIVELREITNTEEE